MAITMVWTESSWVFIVLDQALKQWWRTGRQKGLELNYNDSERPTKT